MELEILFQILDTDLALTMDHLVRNSEVLTHEEAHRLFKVGIG